MRKVYEPLPMIMNGRYAVLYGKLSAKEKEDTLKRMAALIEEELDYEDKGNYGHFCNILPTIAIDEALRRNGKTPEEAFELISTHMWAALTPEAFRKMSRLRCFLPVMKKVIPLGFKFGSGKGWKYVWHKDDPADVYHFECLECLSQLKTVIDRTVARWLEFHNKEFYYIMSAAEDTDTVMDTTLACLRGLADCLDGSVERGIIYGKGVYEKGEIKNHPAMQQAYEMGKSI